MAQLDRNSSSNREIIKFNEFKDVVISYESSPCTFPEHWHLSAEFILVKKDRCQFLVNDEEYLLNSGDILLVWPAQVHTVVQTPPKASVILQFSSEIITQLQDINLICHYLKELHVLRPCDGELYDFVRDGIQECYRIYHSDEKFAETAMKIRIIEMLYQIALYKAKQRTESIPNLTTNTDTYYKIQDACAYIIENYTRDITQKEVAEHVNFSIYYFSRIFKEYTSESFNEFVTRYRLEHAIRLLTSDNISITEVAFQSGFQSISNFNKAFHKAMSCSPKQYRSLWNVK